MELKHKIIKPAISLFACHIAGVVISFIFVIGFASLNGSLLGQIITAVVVLIVYSIPMYSNMWILGNRDLNFCNCGKLKKNYSIGFKIGLVASIPSFVLAIYFFLSKFNITYNIIFLYRMLNSEISPIIQMINNSGHLSSISVGEMAIFSLLTIIPSVLAGVFYIMGFKNITPIRRIMYKNTDK